MAIAAVNSFRRTVILLHYRLFFPRIYGANGITCIKGKDYSTSFPVRYVPNTMKPRDSESCSYSPLKHAEDVQRHRGLKPIPQSDDICNGAEELVKNSALPFAHESSGFHFEVMEEFDADLGPNDGGFIKEPKESVEQIEMKSQVDPSMALTLQLRKMVENLAVQLLARNAYTAAELRKKLQGKKLCKEVVDIVVKDFQKWGLINDSLYAEIFSQSRWSSRSWAPRRIKQALIKKGVSEVHANKAIKLIFEGSGDDDVKLGLEISKPCIDQLLAKASKRWLSNEGVAEDKRKARIARWLVYRGFNWETVKFVLTKLESIHVGDLELEPGNSKPSMDQDQLLIQASKKWVRSRGLPIDKRRARMVQWLQYRGLNWESVKLVLFELESADEADPESGNSGDDEDLESGNKTSMPLTDQLLIQASKQWLRNHGVPKDKRHARIVRWLQYRGLNWETVKFVLKKLESQYPP